MFATQPLRGVFVTHIHPDHIGLAAWLQERYGVPVWMSRRTHATCSSGSARTRRAPQHRRSGSILPLAWARRFAAHAADVQAGPLRADDSGMPAVAQLRRATARRCAGARSMACAGDQRSRRRASVSVERRSARADQRRSGAADDLIEHQLHVSQRGSESARLVSDLARASARAARRHAGAAFARRAVLRVCSSASTICAVITRSSSKDS